MSSDVSSVTNHFATANEDFSTTTSGVTTSGSNVVNLNSVTGLTNGTIFVGVIEPGGSKEQVFTGTVDTSGSRITGVVWTKGTNVEHASGVAVVDYDTGTAFNMMRKGILVQHNQDGTHANTITTNTINENTTDNGVTVDGLNIKDGSIQKLEYNNVPTLYNPYKFHAYRSAAFNWGNNTAAKVSFDTELFDTNNDFASGKYTAPVSGFYQFNSAVAGSTISGAGIYIALYKNGSGFIQGGSGVPVSYTGPFSTSLTLNTILQLTAGDYVEIYAYGANNTGQTGAGATYFNGFLISRT